MKKLILALLMVPGLAFADDAAEAAEAAIQAEACSTW